jgi:hypothetical protein
MELGAELFILTLIFGVMGWLLRRRAEENGNAITDLYRKHEEDARELSDLRIRIADEIYKKRELDLRFDRLDNSICALGQKIDSIRADSARVVP